MHLHRADDNTGAKMEIGEVRIASDEDFVQLKNFADNNTGWKLDYSKGSTKVLTKITQQTDFKMIKLRTIFTDIKAETVYDVLHDPDYRKVWDSHMLESYDVGCLNPNNDVGYYAMRCPPPLKNRDFVLQRSWLETGREYLLLNHSVFHETLPPKKGFIRATSFLTGFVIRPVGDKGCEVNYVTQSDPKGSLPPWIVNKLTQTFAPKMIKRMRKACLGYERWKKNHRPNHKPWLYPEQMTVARISMAQCLKQEVSKSLESLEEEETVLDESKFKDFLDESEEI